MVTTKFSELVIGVRQDLNMNQMEFSASLGVSQGLISKIENDKITTGTDFLVNLARTYLNNKKVRNRIVTFLFQKKKSPT